MKFFNLLSDRIELISDHQKNSVLLKAQLKTLIGSRTDVGILYILEFKGDVMATQGTKLADEVTAIIAVAKPKDKVLIKLNSAGGAVSAYGYAASQIHRLRNAGIHTVVSVDQIAASGGYLMACVANEIIAAPFAIIGSIGVVSEFPNFAKLLDKYGIDYKSYTAGKYKRTVSQFTNITEQNEAKFVDDLNNIHNMFINHIKKYRPKFSAEKATGEHWMGEDALKLGLVDGILTSDEYIHNISRNYFTLNVSIEKEKPNAMLSKFFGSIVEIVINAVIDKIYQMRSL
jgi:serine protease SohB